MARARRRRSLPVRILRVASLVLAGVVLTLVFTLVTVLHLARVPEGQEGLRVLVLGQTKSLLPGLTVGRIGGDLTSTLVLEDVVLDDRFGGEAIRVGRIAASYELGQLRSGVLAVRSLEIDAPVLHVQSARSGKLNLAELVVPSKEEPPPPGEPTSMRLRLGRLRIRNGTVVVQGAPEPLRVQHLELDAGFEGGMRDAALTLRDLRGEVLAQGRQLKADLHGRANWTGTELGADLGVRLAGLTPTGELTLKARAAGPPEKIQLELDLGLPGQGALATRGWVGQRGDQPAYDLAVSLRRINPELLLPGTIPADLSLDLGARGQGVPLQPNSKAELTLEGHPSTVNGLPVQRLELAGTLEGSSFKLGKLQLRAVGAGLRVSGAGALAAGDPNPEIDAQVSLDLPRLDRLPRQLGLARLGLGGNVRLTANLRGRAQGPLAVRAHLRSGSLQARLGAGSSSTAPTQARVERVELDANLTAQKLPGLPSGTVRLRAEGIDPGAGQPKIDELTLDASGRHDRLALDLSARGKGLQAEVGAQTAISDSGKRLRVLLRKLALVSRQHKLALKLRNQPELTVVAGRLVKLTPARLGVLGGEAVVGGVFRPRGFPRLEAKLQLEGVRPPHLPAGHQVSGSVEASLQRRWADANLDLSLAPAGSRLRLQAHLPVRYRGALPMPVSGEEGRLQLKAEQIALDVLSRALAGVAKLPALGGRATVDLDASGTLEAPNVRLGLALQQAALGELRGLDARTELVLDNQQTRVKTAVSLQRRPLLRLDATAGQGLLPLVRTIGGAPSLEQLGAVPLELQLRVHPTSLATLASLDPRKASPLRRSLGQGEGTASAHLQVSGTALQPSLKLELGLAKGRLDRLQLDALAARLGVRVGPRQVEGDLTLELNRRQLLQARGVAQLDLARVVRGGGLERGVPLQLSARVPSFPLEQLGRIDPTLADLGGTLAASVSLGGTSTAPTMRSRLGVRQARFAEVTLGDLNADASFDGRLLQAKLGLRQPGGGRLGLAGSYRPLAKQEAIAARLTGQALDLGFLRKLASEVKESEGKLSLDIGVKGSATRPVIGGHVELKQGKLRLRGISRLEEIEGRVELGQREVRLAALKARGGGGEISASGRVGLPRGLDLTVQPLALIDRFALTAKARKLGLDAGQVTGVVFSGDVGVDGGLRRKGKLLAANVRIRDAVVQMPKIEGRRALHAIGPPRDVTFVDAQAQAEDQAEGAAPTTNAKKRPRKARGIGLRVAVNADPLFVRGEEADLELMADVKATTDAKGRLRLRGRVEVRRGRVQILGYPYDVRQASVVFSGEPDPDPALNVVLARRGPDATVLIGLSGTASSPELTLSSDPPIYDQSQIMSYIVTGRIDARADADADQTATIASAVSQVLLGSIVRRLAPKVGVDVARVSFEESKDERSGESSLKAEAEVGKYLTDRLYVGYRRVFGASANDNTNEGMLEYRISARWLLMALFGDAGVGGVDLVWNLRY